MGGRGMNNFFSVSLSVQTVFFFRLDLCADNFLRCRDSDPGRILRWVG